MGKPYSMDLRERVVAAVKSGMSRNRAAKQFGVAVSTAINWLKRLGETGSVAPGQMGGHKPKKIRGEHRLWLLQRMKERSNDNLIYTVASYNGGPGNVDKWRKRFDGYNIDRFIEAIPFTETRDYTKKVLGYYAAYHTLYPPAE